MTEYVVVPPERAGLELDEFVCLLFPELGKGFVRRQVRKGAVLLDGNLARPSQILRAEQVLVIDFEEPEDAPPAPVAPSVQIPVLYEDEDLMALDKPSGLAVEPERWRRDAASVSGALLQLARDRGQASAEPVADGRAPFRTG